MLVSQSKTICCTTVHFNGLLHLDNNYSMTSKRYAFTDIIGVQTKSRFYELLKKFQLVNPLKKSVSTFLYIIIKYSIITMKLYILFFYLNFMAVVLKFLLYY